MPIYNWHSASSLGWPFAMIKYKYFFNKIYGSNCMKQHSKTVMGFEITEILIAV